MPSSASVGPDRADRPAADSATDGWPTARPSVGGGYAGDERHDDLRLGLLLGVVVGAGAGDAARARSRLMSAATDWSLVGRTDELQQIMRARMARAAVVLHGPEGVGKSRLARETVATAESDGDLVRWVQATRSASAVALGAFAGIVPSNVRSDDRFELLQRAVAGLKGEASGRAFVLGVDDAQWLDPTSATLVLHLALTGTAFVVATVRAGEPCPDAVTSLWKEAGGSRLDIGLLSEADSEALVERILGGPVDRATRRWVAHTSGGNALYIRELLLGARGGHALENKDGLWRLPTQPPVSASLTELVTARLTGLTQAQEHAVELLAIGEPLRVAEMQTLVGQDCLLAVEARGLITIDPAASHPDVRLSHPLYGEVIRAALPFLRAQQVRRQAAKTVLARERPDPGDALRLARWLIEAGDPITTDLTLSAARAANAAGDPDFGADLAARALSAGGGIDAAMLLARAHTVRSRFDEAEAILLAVEADIHTPDLALAYLEQQSEVLHWGLKQPAKLRALLDRAGTWWTDTAWQQRLEPLHLRVTSFERLGFDIDASTDILATAHTDTAVRHQIEPIHAANLFYAGRTREARDLISRIKPGPPMRSLGNAIALSLWSRILLETGEDWPELEVSMSRTLDEGVRLHDHVGAGQAAYSLACLRLPAGRLLDCRSLLAEAAVQLHHHDPVGLLPVIDAMQVEVACFLDDQPEIGPALARCEAQFDDGDPLAHQLPYVVRARAWAAHASGNPVLAQRLLLEAATELAASPVHAARLTYEAMRAGTPPQVAGITLERERKRCDARLVTLYADHAIGRAASDPTTLLRVVDGFDQTGAQRYASEAAAHAADAFARQGRQASARSAATRSRALHAQGQGGLAPPITALDVSLVALTPREQQLVALAAQGLTNSDIADQLVLSVRTVESHLYRAMHKLGVDDRRELTADIG